MELDKFDAARNALCGAIWLYISTPYHSAAYLLACSCIEIVNSLAPAASKKDRERSAKQCTSFKKFCFASNQSLETYKTLYGRIRKKYNFLKHAASDPTKTNNIPEQLTESLIFLAIHDYTTLCGGMPIEAQVFEAWYIATNPHKLQSGHDDYRAKLDILFPDITLAPPVQQKEMCRRQIEKCAGMPELYMEERKPSPFPV